VKVLAELVNREVDFKISILGERTSDVPECFLNMDDNVRKRVVQMEFLSKTDYYRTLNEADVAISTADHEFFGVAM
jgi:hypothetical protein